MICLLHCHQGYAAAQTGSVDSSDKHMEAAVNLARSITRVDYPRLNVAWVAARHALQTAQTRWLDRITVFFNQAPDRAAVGTQSCLRVRWALGWLAAMYEDAEASREQYESLAAFFPGGMSPYHNCDWLRGLLIRMTGDIDGSIRCFEKLLAANKAQGARLAEAWNSYYLAETLLMRGGPSDAVRAKTTLAERMRMTQERGMVLLNVKATTLLESLSGPASRPKCARYPDGLTNREVEVLQHVARGMTS
jgi:hypothetical protein